MSGKIVAIGIFVLTCSLLHAQVDSTLKQQILNYQPVKPELIAKGRSMIQDVFPDGNKEEAMKVARYLMEELESKGYTVFNNEERILLHLWMGEYGRLLFDAERNPHHQAYVKFYPIPYGPADDAPTTNTADLTNVMALETAAHLDSLMWHLRASPLDADQKEFLCIYLKYELLYWYATEVTRDSLSYDAEQFMAAYPESKYRHYVQHYISQVSGASYKRVYTPKPTIFGMDFEVAPLGATVFTGSLNDHFKPCYGLALGLGFYIDRFVIDLRIAGNFSHTKRDIPVEGDSILWKTGSKAFPFMGGGSLGYMLLDKKKVHLTALAGMSMVEFSPTENDVPPELEDFRLKTYAYSAGLSFDYFFKGRRGFENMNGGWFMRIRYTCFWPQFEKKYDNYGGAINNLTVGFGGLLGRGKSATR